MNIAILSYSYTGNNEALAENVARELEAKHIRVSVRKPVTMGAIVLDMLFSRTPRVQPAPDSLRKYDFILFFGPVWMGQVTFPLRAYLNDLKQNPKPYGFLSISGGADGKNPKLSNELLKRTGKQPVLLLDQHIADLLSSNNSITRKETSAYRVNEEDVNRLMKVAVEMIKKEVLNYVVEKTHELMSAPSCSSEAKTAAQTWLDTIGTEREAAETKKYIDELEADIMPIDNLIGFAESDGGIQVFGADTAKNIVAHAKGIKSAGAKYCDCPACMAVAAILEKKDILLK